MKPIFTLFVVFLSFRAIAGVPGLSDDTNELLRRCAPNVHPETMAAVVLSESNGYLFAIADAGPKHLPWSQRKSMVRSFFLPTVTDAVAKAKSLIADGHTVSLGPAQVNDRQLPRLKLTIEEAFDTCTNLRAGGVILGECYERASKAFAPGAKALAAALSCYNSGDFERGARDGYVNVVYANKGKSLVLKTGATKQLERPVTAVSANGDRPWWKRAKRRDFVMSSREFSVD